MCAMTYRGCSVVSRKVHHFCYKHYDLHSQSNHHDGGLERSRILSVLSSAVLRLTCFLGDPSQSSGLGLLRHIGLLDRAGDGWNGARFVLRSFTRSMATVAKADTVTVLQHVACH